MASKFARDKVYEDDRFEYPVSENFKCSICLNVLSNAKSCQNNQHYFCFGCITKHLENFRTCPECAEELTPETLAEPPRFLLNCISELRIKCGYSNRGCPNYVQLVNLQVHIDECGYAPVKCENEECGVEINSQDKVHHETELCKFRKVDCHGCGQLKKVIEEMRKDQEEAIKSMAKKQNEMNEKQKEMDGKMAEMIENQVRVKEGVNEVRLALKSSLDKVDSIISETQVASKPTQKVAPALRHVFQSPQQRRPPINHDVMIMGGNDKDNQPIASVEKYSCKEGRWVELAPMTIPRASASAVVSGNQIIVSGGYTSGIYKTSGHPSRDRTDSIEIMNLDQRPLTWVTSIAKLPHALARHQSFLYKGALIVMFNFTKKDTNQSALDRLTGACGNCVIYRIRLTPPYASKKLCTLPILNVGFRAELVEGKIYLFGGTPKDSYVVLIYDLVTKECREMPGLPVSVCYMSTVLWRNQIILMGGENANCYCLNDVVMYDTETGGSGRLPEMKYGRSGCSAVLTDEIIIVTGGHYNSVEFYDFRTNCWQVFRPMNVRRTHATAVVCPVETSD